MSLKDTIQGALQEAEGNAAGRPKKEVEEVVGDDEKKGFSRSSAAKAKPAREAAASVRTGSKPQSSGLFGKSESKEEKKERRRREREESDMRTRAYDLLLRSIPEYRRTDRIFWVVVGVAMVFAVASLVGMYAFGEVTDITSVHGIVATVTLVAAYALIIGAIIYDFAKRRPFRKRAQAQVNGLTEKRLVELFEQDRAAQLAKQVAREARRKKK